MFASNSYAAVPLHRASRIRVGRFHGLGAISPVGVAAIKHAAHGVDAVVAQGVSIQKPEYAVPPIISADPVRGQSIDLQEIDYWRAVPPPVTPAGFSGLRGMRGLGLVPAHRARRIRSGRFHGLGQAVDDADGSGVSLTPGPGSRCGIIAAAAKDALAVPTPRTVIGREVPEIQLTDVEGPWVEADTQDMRAGSVTGITAWPIIALDDYREEIMGFGLVPGHRASRVRSARFHGFGQDGGPYGFPTGPDAPPDVAPPDDSGSGDPSRFTQILAAITGTLPQTLAALRQPGYYGGRYQPGTGYGYPIGYGTAGATGAGIGAGVGSITSSISGFVQQNPLIVLAGLAAVVLLYMPSPRRR